MESRLVSEENIVLYKDLGDLDQEIEEFLMKYYHNNPISTDWKKNQEKALQTEKLLI